MSTGRRKIELDVNKLLDLIEQHPVLWKLDSSLHKNANFRNRAWKTISAEMGVDLNSVKKKWKNLQDTYRQKKKKKPSGTGAESDKPQDWDYFGAMDRMLATYVADPHQYI